MKRAICIILMCTVLLAAFAFSASAEGNLSDGAKSAILIEASTGKILYESNSDERLSPASVTKIMTILLIVEELEKGTVKLTDIVQASENASKMGGSQIFLKAGEQMSVEDLLKSVIVASANDAATALAETVSGSVESFVERMNTRALELGMTNTHFENPTGLDDTTTDHLTSARDIAIMSRELLSHEMVFKYTTIWMDTIRDGQFGLTNTNRLIRFYSGANGLKTGSTSRAGFCISASAKRDGMQLIAVIMGAPTRDERNEIAKKLFDYGFANYKLVSFDEGEPEPLKIQGGVKGSVPLKYGSFSAVLEKGEAVKGVAPIVNLPQSLTAPIYKGEVVGTVDYMVGDSKLGVVNIYATETVEKISFFGLFGRLLSKFFLK